MKSLVETQGMIMYSDIDSQKHANKWLKEHVYL